MSNHRGRSLAKISVHIMTAVFSLGSELPGAWAQTPEPTVVPSIHVEMPFSAATLQNRKTWQTQTGGISITTMELSEITAPDVEDLAKLAATNSDATPVQFIEAQDFIGDQEIFADPSSETPAEYAQPENRRRFQKIRSLFTRFKHGIHSVSPQRAAYHWKKAPPLDSATIKLGKISMMIRGSIATLVIYGATEASFGGALFAGVATAALVAVNSIWDQHFEPFWERIGLKKDAHVTPTRHHLMMALFSILQAEFIRAVLGAVNPHLDPLFGGAFLILNPAQFTVFVNQAILIPWTRAITAVRRNVFNGNVPAKRWFQAIQTTLVGVVTLFDLGRIKLPWIKDLSIDVNGYMISSVSVGLFFLHAIIFSYLKWAPGPAVKFFSDPIGRTKLGIKKVWQRIISPFSCKDYLIRPDASDYSNYPREDEDAPDFGPFGVRLDFKSLLRKRIPKHAFFELQGLRA